DPKIMNVIDSNIFEKRDAGGKPLHTFPHPSSGVDLHSLSFRREFEMRLSDSDHECDQSRSFMLSLRGCMGARRRLAHTCRRGGTFFFPFALNRCELAVHTPV
ncbi:MAG TPA: hypothetical protein VFS91_12115, partial [Nitrobacter sp.]|nr:hypothetical protein [Nitrobacter sp.]